MTVKIEKTWVAEIKDVLKKGEDLSDMVGKWSIGVDIDITIPYTYSYEPIKRVFLEEYF